MLLVSQREAVRKAQVLGPKRAARLSCFLTAAAWPWRSALLQPWFLEEMKTFVSSSDTGFEGIYGHWLQMSSECVEHVEAWPEPVAWYLEKSGPKSRFTSSLLDVYGSPERLMGWEAQDDSDEPSGASSLYT